MDGVISKQMFRNFREDHGILKATETVIPYKLREEQQSAVSMTVDYQATHKNGEFLWNAKPRFGKTLSVYDFVQKIRAEKSVDRHKSTGDCKFMVFRLCQIPW